jgi:hypothetical protein
MSPTGQTELIRHRVDEHLTPREIGMMAAFYQRVEGEIRRAALRRHHAVRLFRVSSAARTGPVTSSRVRANSF